MEQIKILAYGGDALTMLSTDGNMPHNVVNTFNDSIGKWDTDVSELYQYLDRPVDEKFRLFVRHYKHEPGRSRAVSYEVGFLLPRSVYLEASNLQVLYKKLFQISHDTLRQCWESCGVLELNLADVEERREMRKSSHSLSSPWMLCGESKFDENLEEVTTSFVSSDIDNWFTKLYLVVNPYQTVNDSNVTVSRREMAYPTQLSPPSPTQANRLKKGMRCAVLAVAATGTCVYVSELTKEVQELKAENKSLRTELQQLKEALKEEKKRITELEMKCSQVCGEKATVAGADFLCNIVPI